MKWRDVLAGAIATLAMTVIGGIIVFYVTKEPEEKKSEKLVYVLNRTASFTGGVEDLAISSITITNEGGLAASHVSVLVGVSKSEIRDLAISSGHSLSELVRERTTKNIRILYETLLPEESITINLLLTSSERPSIDVRSDATLGKERKQFDASARSHKSKPGDFISTFLPSAGLVYVLLSLGLVFSRRRGMLRGPNQNDTGFLLIHHGLIDEAESVLDRAVHDGHCDQFTLSNYALCKAAKGDFDQVKSLLRAATFRKGSSHGKAVVLFNDAIIHLMLGNR